MNIAGTLHYDTKLETKNFEDGIEALNTKSVAMGNLISDAFKKVTSKLKDVVTSAIEVGSSFEAQMSKVQSISGATGKELDALKEKAKEMGAKTKFSATESAEAMEYMAMAGWKTSDMLDGIEGIMNLAAASGEELGTTSDIVTDALTAFGLKASDAAHFSDILAVASSNSNTNVSMMGETFKYAASIAGSLGYSAEDTALAIGLMANAGVKASNAGTALRSIMSRIATNTAGARDALKELGIETVNSDGSMRNFKDVLTDIRTKFKDLSAEEQANYAKTIAGQTALSGFLAIANSADEDFNKLSDAIANADGTSENMAETMQDNLKGKITLMKSELEGLGIKIYEKLEEPLSNVVDFIKDSLLPIIDDLLDGGKKAKKWLKDNEQPLTLLGILIGTITTAIIAYNIAMNIATITTTIATTVTGAFGAVMAFVTSPITLVILAIGALIAIIYLLIKNWDTVKEKAISIFNWLADFFKGIGEKIGGFFSGMFDVGKNIVTGIWNGIAGAKDYLLNKIKGFAKTITNGIKSFFGIHSPSKLMRDEVGDNLILGLGTSFEKDANLIDRQIKSLGDDITQKMRNAVSLETGNIMASAALSSAVANNSSVQVHNKFDGYIELDGQKVGRLITPVVSQTLRTVGA